MSEEILYIENKRVDLTPDTIHRTLQINNIGDAKDRQANYSNMIKLPKTPNNVLVFDFLGISGNKSDKPYRKLSCRYIVDGIPLIQNGYAVVRGTTSHYELVIYDGNIDLAERIKGRKINQLDFSDLNHYLTQSTYENSLSNTEGYIYAVGEFIPRSSFSRVQINEQAPCLFVKTIWDKIWNESGLKYSGPFFSENEDFQTEVISPEKGYEVENVALQSTNLGTGQTNIISHLLFTNDPNIRFEDQHTFSSGSYTGITKNADGSLTINQDAQLKFDIETSFTNNDSYVQLRIKINGSTKTSITLDQGGSSKTTSLNLTLNQGDVITFVVYGTYDYNQSNEENPNLAKYQIDYSASSVINITEQTGGQLIDFSLFTTDMDQLAFVKDVMQRYGLLLKPVRNTGTYEFIQFETLLNDKAKAEDWSDKLSTIDGEDYDIQYARENEATYSYPDELVDHLYDGVLSIDNDNASPTKNLFSSMFQIAKKRPTKYQGATIYQAHIWEEKEDDGEIIIDQKQTPVKLFRIVRFDTSIGTYFFDNANSVTITGLIPFLSLDNIQMQYFLNRYYKAFQSLINRSKKVMARFLFNEIDIYDLDFFRLKYIKQTGKYYYLNNVKHSPGKLNKAELIQLNGFSVNLPPTMLGVYDLSMNYEGSRSISIANITDQSNPAYYDPEFDEPLAIKITGGFNPDILIKNGAQVLSTETEILVENWDITIEDAANTTAAHSAVFTFKIKDAGSGKYSEVEGSIEVSVNAYVNNPPVADAGPDQVVEIPEDEFDTTINLDGSGSTDNTGEITYSWSLISKPINSTGFIQTSNSVTTNLKVPNTSDSIGTYTIELTVTDEFGLTDTDTVQIQVNQQLS